MKLTSKIYKAGNLSPVAALVVGALLTLGCGRIIVEHADTGPTAPPYQGEVTVIMEGGEQPVGMREIAIVQVTATGVKAKLPTAIDALKVRARSLGCNTVAKVSVDRSNTMVVTGVCGLVE
jgi:hypothetical protein